MKVIKKRKLSDFELNKENPFVKQALVNIGNALVSKSVKGTNKDESAILKGIDSNGEILGNSVFIRSKTVDTENFTKFFLAGFKAFFDLKPASIKVFGFILEQLKPNQDSFMFIMDECKEQTGYSEVSIFRALGELCSAEIIARGRFDVEYYVNPMCVFNGDRVTFATTYINTNFPSYKTSQRRLKGTITQMQSEGKLPQLPFEEYQEDKNPTSLSDKELQELQEKYDNA